MLIIIATASAAKQLAEIVRYAPTQKRHAAGMSHEWRSELIPVLKASCRISYLTTPYRTFTLSDSGPAFQTI
jgi:hypothetical protein